MDFQTAYKFHDNTGKEEYMLDTSRTGINGMKHCYYLLCFFFKGCTLPPLGEASPNQHTIAEIFQGRLLRAMNYSIWKFEDIGSDLATTLVHKVESQGSPHTS